MKVHKKGVSARNAGFTLIEMIIVLALIGLVGSVAGSLINFSVKAEDVVEREYDLQAQVRHTSELLNNAIRDSSVTFTLPDAVFLSAKKEKWNYFGIEDKKEIVQYIYNPDTGSHDRKVIVAARDGILYNLYFASVVPGSKLVRYNLDVVRESGDSNAINIVSEVAALNSVAVDDGGSLSNPATAIAYRSDPSPKPEEVTTSNEVRIAISLVLDDSGSMDFDMQGKKPGDWGFNSNQVRKNIMKNEAQKLIDQFADLGNIYVSVIPFATTANTTSANPGTMRDTTTEKAELKNEISKFDAYGGTNTGDGLRRAYHRLKNYKADNPSAEIVHYIIMLTDGDPTYRTGTTRSGTYEPRTNDGNTSDDYIWGEGNNDGHGGTTNLNNCMAYARTIGNIITGDSAMDIGTFVIGFSAVPGDIANNKKIAEDYCKGTYYVAGNDIELESTFDEITATILRETWHIYGPY